MTRVSEVLAKCFELEDQMAQVGWDIGVGAWAMHDDSHEEEGDTLSALKLFGPEYINQHPVELASAIPPPPTACWVAIALGYEGWIDGVETRFVLAAIRDHDYVLIMRKRNDKPKGYLLDEHRLLTYNGDAVCDVAHNLRHAMPPTPVADNPLMSLLSSLGVRGFIIAPGPWQQNEGEDHE